MAFSFAPQQQQQQQSPFQSPFNQSNTFRQTTPSQPQQQPQSPLQFQIQQSQPQPQVQQTQPRERILGYRDESQRLDQCSRLYDSSVPINGFENDASSIMQELGGISVAIDRQKEILQELMTVVKDMLLNTEGAVRSFMMLQPRFIHQNKVTAASASAHPNL